MLFFVNIFCYGFVQDIYKASGRHSTYLRVSFGQVPLSSAVGRLPAISYTARDTTYEHQRARFSSITCTSTSWPAHVSRSKVVV